MEGQFFFLIIVLKADGPFKPNLLMRNASTSRDLIYQYTDDMGYFIRVLLQMSNSQPVWNWYWLGLKVEVTNGRCQWPLVANFVDFNGFLRVVVARSQQWMRNIGNLPQCCCG